MYDPALAYVVGRVLRDDDDLCDYVSDLSDTMLIDTEPKPPLIGVVNFVDGNLIADALPGIDTRGTPAQTLAVLEEYAVYPERLVHEPGGLDNAFVGILLTGRRQPSTVLAGRADVVMACLASRLGKVYTAVTHVVTGMQPPTVVHEADHEPTSELMAVTRRVVLAVHHELEQKGLTV